jgi:hypothetical protein
MGRSVGATAPNGHYQYRATIMIASIKMDVLNITDTMHRTITRRVKKLKLQERRQLSHAGVVSPRVVR